MPSNEPRVNAPAGEKTTPSAPGNGSGAAVGNGSGAATGNGGPGGTGSTTLQTVKTVTVAASVESALAAVQQQLEREAEKVRLVPVEPAPLPTPAPAPPALRVREVTPVVVEPASDYDDEDLEAEFWNEPRRRPTQRKVDPKLLTREERKALGKLKARKVRRIVRHVSPWSVFKFSIFFYLCVWLILMVAGVILWKLSQTAGVIENFEKFYAKAAGEKSFEIDGRSLFRAGSTAGAILVFAATAFTVLMSVLFNLITDLTGGIRLTVIELESTRRTVRRRAGSERLRSRAKLDDQELERAERSRSRRNGTKQVAATSSGVVAKTAPRAASDAVASSTSSPTTSEVVPEPRRRPDAKAADSATSTSSSRSTSR